MTETVIDFSVPLQKSSLFCLCQLIESSTSCLQLLSAQLRVTVLTCRIKHAVPARLGPERLTVNHQNVHDLAECNFWSGCGQKTAFAIFSDSV